MPRPLPQEPWLSYIDVALWDQQGSELDPPPASTRAVNTSILSFIASYAANYNDYLLFDAVTETFWTWNCKTFDLADPLVRKHLWSFLRQNGVHVGSLRERPGPDRISKQLAHLVSSEEMEHWPAIELARQYKEGVMNSRWDLRSGKILQHVGVKSLTELIRIPNWETNKLFQYVGGDVKFLQSEAQQLYKAVPLPGPALELTQEAPGIALSSSELSSKEASKQPQHGATTELQQSNVATSIPPPPATDPIALRTTLILLRKQYAQLQQVTSSSFPLSNQQQHWFRHKTETVIFTNHFHNLIGQQANNNIRLWALHTFWGSLYTESDPVQI